MQTKRPFVAQWYQCVIVTRLVVGSRNEIINNISPPISIEIQREADKIKDDVGILYSTKYLEKKREVKNTTLGFKKIIYYNM